MSGRLRTRGSRRGNAAHSEQTASNVAEKRTSGDQRQVGSERIKNEGVAEEAEVAGTASSWRGVQEAPKNVHVTESNVSKRVSASSEFCSERGFETLLIEHLHYSCVL